MKLEFVREQTVGFDGFRALAELDFTMSDGELRFFIGPNGAGKTTLMKSIMGLEKLQGGDMTLDESKAREYLSL